MIKRFLERLGVLDSQEWVALINAGLRIIVILVIAWVVLHIAGKLIKLFKSYMSRQGGDPEQVKRVDTLARVFRYTATVVVTIVAGMLVLSELGISIAPVLATAGVAGIAIGFGAQSLIKDYFTGFFILLENQIRQGDVVDIAGKSGLVEEMTLRYIRLRDYEGNVHYVPNGTITTVTNRSRGFAFAVMDVAVAYKEDLDKVMDVMREVGQALRADPVFGPRIIDDLEMAGVDQLAESSVVLRCRMRVLPLEQAGVRREFLRRVKGEFDRRGIEIPYPHLTIFRRGEAQQLGAAAEPAVNRP